MILDKKKMKTPMGKLFVAPTEALALAVAHEWNSQKDVIKRHSMHLVRRAAAVLQERIMSSLTFRSLWTRLRHKNVMNFRCFPFFNLPETRVVK